MTKAQTAEFDEWNKIFLHLQMEQSLLQTYRTMALTLLGLLASGVLVGVVLLLQSWDFLDSLIWYLASESSDWLKRAAHLVLFLIVVLLLVMGVHGSRKFKSICLVRASKVTTLQNLLIAQDFGAIEEIAQRHGLETPLPFQTMLRFYNAPNSWPFAYESPFDMAKSQAFLDSINGKGLNGEPTANQSDTTRHHKTRVFLNSFIFNTFFVFFGFSALLTLIVLVRMI